MPTLTDRIARALAEGTVEHALERVFVGELGWKKSKGAIAESGGRRLTLGDGDFSARGDDESLVIAYRDGEAEFRLPLRRLRPAGSALAVLARLRAGAAVREGGDPIRECFDPNVVTRAFLSDYQALFDRHKGTLVTLEGRRLRADEAEEFLNRFLLRVLLVAFLQSRGWLSFSGRKDYLQALYADWRIEPGAHLFHQRLALVFFNALDEARPEARAMLERQIGRVPYIGGGVFSPELFEKEFETVAGFAALPEELFEELFGEGGLIDRYEFSMQESAPNVTVVAVTPEAMGAALSAFLKKGDVPIAENTASHRRACRRMVAAQLGTSESLELPEKWEDLQEWAEVLRGIHVFEGSCGSGTYLVAALEELTEISDRVDQALGVPMDRPSTKRRVARENLRGLDQDEKAVQVARLRLMLSILTADESPRVVPDLRQIVRRGGALAGVQGLPPEGPNTEYKASFEWDPRRGARSPEMRFGSLRTVAAFLNSEGGELYIGVADDGTPVGLEGDFALIEDGTQRDAFEARFREFMKNALDPMPLNSVRFAFREMAGETVCVVLVEASPVVTYLSHKDKAGQDVESVFVRDGNRTIELRGRSRDAFVVARSSVTK